ncbi:single-stranded DNA-binding protein [Nonomuraea glycinis]|uniref:Single-stranded DNA-binding protein n=1 Tax=Nonomuraea glycinis TaxID=2047744 RepID=A0A918E513_9ACTN|nr:single-stranded DNA-binding protein [Nonomuraea glycinis]MCA2175828.1 single-stranded DNA-binding protein [Nonomuraea glycinis]GGP05459.1 single-stranded DNA-binding protein [Nonomuraea glycinis]
MSGETTITIIGNLTNDPELRFTQTGTAVATFTIASSPRTYNKQLEQWEDGEALFMRCSAWRDLGEHICESLTRGTRVIASGQLRMRTYETDEGEHRTVFEMTVDEIGPSLRFATAKPTRAARKTPTSQNGNAPDTWAATAPTGDKPPF